MTAIFFLILGLALEGMTSWIAIRVAKKRHPALWVHSGQPTLLGNGDLMKAWPLVKYYHNRMYLETVRREDQQLPPVSEAGSIEFAERLRKPFFYTYIAGWVGGLICLLLLLTTSIASS